MLYANKDQYFAIFDHPHSIGWGIYSRDASGVRILSGEYTPPLMQFTGLLDRNGKEIYEGDIIDGHSDNLLPQPGVVEFKNGSYGFRINDLGHSLACICLHNWRKFEVIGNIHQTPDLIPEFLREYFTVSLAEV